MKEWSTILWFGRNNHNLPVVLDDMAAAVSWLAPSNNRYVILGMLNGAGAYEQVGGRVYRVLLEANEALQRVHNGHFLDIRSYLVSQANQNDPRDQADVAQDVVPSSLRSDSIHLNARGYSLVAEQVQRLLVELTR